ncbi:MAG: 7TM-DISM domain-containing protein [Bifidobacteriaceae bacterium]|jgi:hypothetical protein|nr:7TM-DISM domain-containing protein [Bifidobacteriaceae bacterium]
MGRLPGKTAVIVTLFALTALACGFIATAGRSTPPAGVPAANAARDPRGLDPARTAAIRTGQPAWVPGEFFSPAQSAARSPAVPPNPLVSAPPAAQSPPAPWAAAPLLAMGALFAMMLLAFAAWLWRPGYRARLYFSAMCFGWFLYVGTSASNALETLWPWTAWAGDLRLGPLSFPILAFASYLVWGRLFPEANARWVQMASCGVALSGAALAVAAPPPALQSISRWYQAFSVGCAVYLGVRTARFFPRHSRTRRMAAAVFQGMAAQRASAQAQAQARAAAAEREALEATTALRGELAQAITTQMHTPLAAIEVFADSTADRAASGSATREEMAVSLAAIGREAKRLSALFDRIAATG